MLQQNSPPLKLSEGKTNPTIPGIPSGFKKVGNIWVPDTQESLPFKQADPDSNLREEKKEAHNPFEMTPQGHSRARATTLATPPHHADLDEKLESIEQKQFEKLAEEPDDDDEDENLLKSL